MKAGRRTHLTPQNIAHGWLGRNTVTIVQLVAGTCAVRLSQQKDSDSTYCKIPEVPVSPSHRALFHSVSTAFELVLRLSERLQLSEMA